MQIVSPRIIDKYIKSIPLGKFNNSSGVQDDLARKYKTDARENNMTEFQKVVKLNSKLAAKLLYGAGSITIR